MYVLQSWRAFCLIYLQVPHMVDSKGLLISKETHTLTILKSASNDSTRYKFRVSKQLLPTNSMTHPHLHTDRPPTRKSPPSKAS
jgi:hypothetical protein